MPLSLPIYKVEIFFVPAVTPLADATPNDVRYVASLAEASWIDKVLRSGLPNDNDRCPRLRVTSLPIPTPELAAYASDSFPPCVHCGEPGVDYAEHGEAWHHACFILWQKEYNAHLDSLYPDSPDR